VDEISAAVQVVVGQLTEKTIATATAMSLPSYWLGLNKIKYPPQQENMNMMSGRMNEGNRNGNSV